MPKKKESPKNEVSKLLEEFTEDLVTPGERKRMIAEAAYYRAEQHGFDPTSIEEDWYEAEKAIDSVLFREAEESLAH